MFCRRGDPMNLLYWLADLRTAVGDAFFMTVTNLGDEAAAIAILLIVFWCINKKAGYFMVYSTVFGMLVNQFLKSLFAIPRPWIRDPQFQPVAAAKETAGGYSFPSGHTANAVAVYGSAALYFKKNWVRILCVAIIAIVALSRMYLGVHTPADVGVSLVIGLVMILVLKWALEKTDESEKAFWILQVVMLLSSVGLFLYLNAKGIPNDPNLTEEELIHGAASALENSWKILGMWLGLSISHWYDRFRKPFVTEAVWWAQILKFVIGIGLVLAVKSGLKAPLLALFGGHQVANAVRYFLILLMAGLIWPQTFSFWSKLGRKKK